MKIRIKIRDTVTRDEWFEEYNRPAVISQYRAKVVARNIVARFNEELSEHENPREVVSAKLLRDEPAQVPA